MREKNSLKLGFWNVVGIMEKNEEFWERIKRRDKFGENMVRVKRLEEVERENAERIQYTRSKEGK